MKRLLIILFSLFFSVNVWAVTVARTTSASLNVRSEPNGKVLFALPQNSIVGVMRVQGGWAMIMYLPGDDPNKAKYGWVSSSYLRVVNSAGSSNSARSYSQSGDNCEYEYDSNAQVCVTVTDADMDCRESYDGSYYRSCEVEVGYKLTTEYEGDDYLDVDVECEVEIKYKKRDGYSWSYDSDSESQNHSLYSYGSESGNMDFDFTYSAYEEVISVKIDSIDCKINSVHQY